MLAGDPRFEAIDAMTSKDFEFALVDLFELLQYEDVQRIGTFEDDADLIVVEDGERIAVQAKRASMPVRIETVQRLVDGMRRYGCVRGLIVTNSFFTDEAIAFAREWAIELWDRKILAQYIDGEEPSARAVDQAR